LVAQVPPARQQEFASHHNNPRHRYAPCIHCAQAFRYAPLTDGYTRLESLLLGRRGWRIVLVQRWLNDRFAPQSLMPDIAPAHTRPSDVSRRSSDSSGGLVAQLGLFQATMAVMGGIVGSGIFINPYVVASLVHTRFLILAAWVAGGAFAMLGACIYAELAARMPNVGGQYSYLREALQPLLGFLFGWAYLLVIGAGGTAIVAITCAKYIRQLAPISIPENILGVAVIIFLVVVNCMGVRAGSGVQSLLMVLRILAIVLIIAGGVWFLIRHGAAPSTNVTPAPVQPFSLGLSSIFGAALVPVLFAYGGWESSNFIATEIREPRKNLPRALILGVLGVLVLYLSVNLIYVQVLTPTGLAATDTPASTTMSRIFGATGAAVIGLAIVISTLGFLSQAMLTYPRLYFAMAGHAGLPAQFARVSRGSRAPVAAILLQGCVTTAVILLGTYEQILSYVVVMDWLFFGLTAACLFSLRRRDLRMPRADAGAVSGYRLPGHPWTTGIFVSVAGAMVINTIYKYPRNAGIAVCILLAGIPFYFFSRQRRLPFASAPEDLP
jgi:APA family basic amino acid/polyamine antiporter